MEDNQQKYESDFRAGLKAAVADTQTKSPEHSQPTENSMGTEAGSRTDGNTQVESKSGTTSTPSKSSAPITEYEIGGKKFKSWDEAKVEVKRLENLDSLYGRQANELKQHRARVAELEKSEVAEFVKQYKQYPDLQEEVLGAYKRWNQMKAGGATNAQATAATGMTPELAKELADLKQFRSGMTEFIKAQQEQQQKAAEQAFLGEQATRVDAEEKELRSAYPNLDEETFKACCKVAQRFMWAVDPDSGKPTPMTLLEAKEYIDAQNRARKGAPAEIPGEAGRTTSLREVPPGPKDLSDVDEKGQPTGAGRKHIKQLIRQYKKDAK